MNMKNVKNDAPAGNGGRGRQPGNFSLARHPSVYSLTFEEFMNTMGGPGKDFGSMNMDELLKNIWTAEEMQTMASTSGVQPVTGIYGGGGGHLQKQGSLTLPRTISQKTVDEVWRDISKDEISALHGGPNFPHQQRQPTLGEMTLEEFLVRAGVVREDVQLVEKPNGGGIFPDLSHTGNHGGIKLGYPQFNNNVNDRLTLQSPTTLNVNGIRSNQHQMPNSQSPTRLQPQILPKQANMPYAATPMPLMSNNQGINGGIVGIANQDVKGNIVAGSALQGGGIDGMGLGHGGVASSVSPANQLSCDETGKMNGDSTSSVSPVPYVFNGGFRGRKSNGAVEKVIERRQRRMIKNRESAARSRARKQVRFFSPFGN